MYRGWNVTAHATIKLLNHANLEKSYSKGCKGIDYNMSVTKHFLHCTVFDHNFSHKSSDWGYSSFMKWKVQYSILPLLAIVIVQKCILIIIFASHIGYNRSH